MVKIKSIKYIGKQDVYNMEVEKHHNFSIQDGLIVHNCDSLRYGLMSRPRARLMEKAVDIGKLPDDCLSDYMKSDPATRRYLAKKWGLLK